ncbi:MAG: hypothetical protein PVJ66_05005 [Gammaproteobacteria bacterium]|jgi:hypothetical protein
MNMPLEHETRKKLLIATIAAAVLCWATPAAAWWGPGMPYAGGWDPQEAYLEEYGFLDPHGPTPGDIRRMQRDRWKELMGYPVYRAGVGPYGPTLSDVRRQHFRKARRLWRNPYW